MTKRLRFKPYDDEHLRWPNRGHVLLAQYDAESIVLYRAMARAAAARALQDGSPGPAEGDGRMVWLRTGFLWTMHHTEWATAAGQNAVLAIWVAREAFDALLAQARQVRGGQAAADAGVLIQWDPDYPPHGPKLKRRVPQLGLRGDALRSLAPPATLHIEDVTPLVHQQAPFRQEPDMLLVPAQRLYPVPDAAVAQRLGLDKAMPG